MPVATILAIAVAFWNQAGFPTVAQTWDWENKQPENGYIEQGHAYLGSNHVTFNRLWWDTATNTQRCSVAIHEVGHAGHSFQHVAGTVMDPDGAAFPPGICKPEPGSWQTIAGKDNFDDIRDSLAVRSARRTATRFRTASSRPATRTRVRKHR